MSEDDISERLLKGDRYEQARVLVRQTFSFSIDSKLRFVKTVLAVSVLLGPAVYFRRSFVREIEPSVTAGETLAPSIGLLAAYGLGITFLAGLFLIRIQFVIATESLSEERARRLVRIEDLVMWFAVFGAAFIFISTGLAVTGVLAPAVIESLYANEVVVYRQSETLTVPIGVVSGIGGVLTVGIIALQRLTPAREQGETRNQPD